MKRAERRAAARSANVLVVDDEPDIRELLELTLVKMGLGVQSVGSIAEAKERLKSDRYDLCLTDMRLSDGEGLELVRHIAGLGTDLPVAVITAHGSAENAVAALKAGAFDYVSKPVGLEQLRALVKSALSLPDSAAAPAKGQRLLGESAPLAQARELIGKGGPVGRKLDFLAQEFHREVNTCCSKSNDIELTNTGLAMKNVVEQFREQVQNLE